MVVVWSCAACRRAWRMVIMMMVLVLHQSTGVKDFIDLLHKRGTHVYLVSGGFRLVRDSLDTAIETIV